MPETIVGDIYDYPKYYDVLFGSDWKAEFDFLEDCFERHTPRVVRRLFEPACGTGRLLMRLAEAGYEVSGNDLNAKANYRFGATGQVMLSGYFGRDRFRAVPVHPTGVKDIEIHRLVVGSPQADLH